MTAWTGTQDADADIGTTDADTLDGAGGNDTLVGNGGLDQITGGEGDDRLEGAGTLDGGAGADTITSYGGVAYGGEGGDHIILEYGAGDVWGGAGDDVVTLESYSTAGIVNGGEGFDTLEIVSSGVLSHFMAATAGFEALNASSSLFYGGSDTLVGDTLDFTGMTVTSAHGLIVDLREGDDSLYGEAGDDVIQGNGGDDYIKSLTGEGHDTVDGGAGTDLLTLERTAETHDLHVDLTLTGVQHVGDYFTGANDSTFVGIEQIRFAGGSGNDDARGGDLDDVLKGGAGADTLVGGGGADILQGGWGRDVLTGGAGADTFRFDSAGASHGDEIVDFSHADGDRIALSMDAFDIRSLDGVLVDNHAGGAVAHNGGFFISYDTTGQNLYLFTDDAHGDQRLLLGHLDGVDSLSASDFALF